MSELRVPTVAVAAEVLCCDGRSFLGRIFIPATSSHHSGPMRAQEWLNDPQPFFPFLPDASKTPVILNKSEVLVISVAAVADRGDVIEEGGDGEQLEQRVCVEAERRRMEGTVVIDMPPNHRRLLDYLNRAEAFLTLRDGDRHHLVRKERITRVRELKE